MSDEKKKKKAAIIASIIGTSSLIGGGGIAAGTIYIAEEKTEENEEEKKKTQQDTIYIDKNGKKVISNEIDLSDIDTKEVTQIGFFKTEQGEIQVVQMPKTIEKVPTKLPQEITSLSCMFTYASAFNQDISSWKVDNVTDMHGMFAGATSFNQDLSKWDTSNVINMYSMFEGTSTFNGNISNWNTSNVINMNSMFSATTSFNQNLSTWKVDKVKDMGYMFKYATSFNQDLSKWDTSNVINMHNMFYGASNFNQDLSKWNVNKVTAYSNFAINSVVNGSNKLPKFNKKNNDDQFKVQYRAAAHDWIKVKISYDTFLDMKTIIKNVKPPFEVKHNFFRILQDFPKIDNTGSGGSIIQSDYETAVSIIINNFTEINAFFKKLQKNKGLLIITNRIGSWDKNDYMGIFSE